MTNLAVPAPGVLQADPLDSEAALMGLVVAADGYPLPQLVMTLLLPDPALR